MAIDLGPVCEGSLYDSAPTAVAPPFRVDVGVDPEGTVLALFGDADLATATLLAQALTHASANGHARVCLDVEGLEFVDAYCLGVIAGARNRLQEQGRDLVVRSPSALMRRVMTIVNMQDLIDPAQQRQSI